MPTERENQGNEDELEEIEIDIEVDMSEVEAEKEDVPDKPTDIAPGDVDYPGKGAPPKGSKGGAPIREAQRAERTGPKGGDYGAATQGG